MIIQAVENGTSSHGLIVSYQILFILKIVDVTLKGKITIGNTTQHTTKQTCTHNSVSDNYIQGKNKKNLCTMEYYFINKNYAKHISVKTVMSILKISGNMIPI